MSIHNKKGMRLSHSSCPFAFSTVRVVSFIRYLMLSSGLLKNLLCYYFMFNCKLAHMYFCISLFFWKQNSFVFLKSSHKYFKTLNPIHLLAPAAQVFTLSKSNETFVQSQKIRQESLKIAQQVTRSDMNLVHGEYSNFLTDKTTKITEI